VKLLKDLNLTLIGQGVMEIFQTDADLTRLEYLVAWPITPVP
jgi:hypothetical protein